MSGKTQYDVLAKKRPKLKKDQTLVQYSDPIIPRRINQNLPYRLEIPFGSTVAEQIYFNSIVNSENVEVTERLFQKVSTVDPDTGDTVVQNVLLRANKLTPKLEKTDTGDSYLFSSTVENTILVRNRNNTSGTNNTVNPNTDSKKSKVTTMDVTPMEVTEAQIAYVVYLIEVVRVAIDDLTSYVDAGVLQEIQQTCAQS